MERYRNLGGDSNIVEFAIESDSITVRFRDGSLYLYDYRSPGGGDVEHMKKLAESGQGLNSFISRVVKKRYSSKLK